MVIEFFVDRADFCRKFNPIKVICFGIGVKLSHIRFSYCAGCNSRALIVLNV